MKFTKIALASAVAVMFASCGGSNENKTETTDDASATESLYSADDTVAVAAAEEAVEAENTASSDVDAAIDAYDKLMDRYISMAKKASKGDPSVLADYASLGEELEDCERKLDALEGNMTAAQAARFQKIVAKQAQAAAAMAGDAAGNAAAAASAMGVSVPGL